MKEGVRAVNGAGWRGVNALREWSGVMAREAAPLGANVLGTD